MENDCNRPQPRILLITTLLCSYPGADTAGQMHQEYAPNTYVMRAPAPIVFPEDFYIRAFERGIDGIIIMSAGSDCPYIGAYEKMAKRIPRVYEMMKERGLDTKRLRLTAICSVCTKAFLKEINGMVDVLNQLGPIDRDKGGKPTDGEAEAN